MADISKVKLPDNSIYDINDATARSGLNDKMDKANPTGTGALSLNRKSGTTTGLYSVAEGYNATASGDRSHAEGSGTKASALGAHSEGSYTTASGNFSHAEGDLTTTSGLSSHAEGIGTIANHSTQHVFGQYNIADTSSTGPTERGTYVEIVGRGTADNARSNARTLDWDGNETLAGDLIFNGNTSLTNKFIYEKTASGSIVTFNDGGNNIPMKSCEVAIVAQQAGSGTPSPSNPRAISGFDSVVIGQTVRNIFRGILYQANTYFDSTGVFTSNAYFSVYYVDIKKDTTYTISLTESASSGTRVVRVGTFNSNNGLIEIASNTYSASGRRSLTFSFNSDFDHALVLLRNTISDAQLELGSTATTYEAPTTTTVSLGQTIYGGTAELVGGNGTKTMGVVIDLGALTWTKGSKSFYASINDIKLFGEDIMPNLKCETYKTVTYNTLVGETEDKVCSIDRTLKILLIRDTSYNDATAFKNSVSGVKAIYELETPTAFTFTGANIPTLSGVNNVYADSGDINELEYFNKNTDEIADAIRSETTNKMDKVNPTGSGALSINRKASTTVGTNSTTLGNDSTASGTNSIAEGWLSVASGTSSHAEGSRSEASNTSAHAEGTQTAASGSASHSEGSNTVASGNYGSHAEGSQTTASGDCSHAEGYKTTANRLSQHVFGEWNVVDTAGADGTVRGNYVEIVGNGTSNGNRSNARTLDWNGNEVLAGDLIFNGSTSLTNKFIYEKTASGSIVTFNDGGNNIPMKSCEVAIVAQQAGSGTPSPTNVRSITGWSACNLLKTGKNLLRNEPIDVGTFSGVTVSVTSAGKIVLNGTATSNNSVRVGQVRLPAGSYKFSGMTQTGSESTFFLNLTPQWGGTSNQNLYSGDYSGSPTVTRDYAVRIYFRSGQSFNNLVFEPMIRLANESSTFEKFGGVDNIPFGQTIYGGTAELVGGNGTKTFGYLDLGELNWGKLSSVTGAFYSIQPTAYAPRYNNDYVANAICEQYKVVSRNNLPNNDCSFSISYSDQVYLTVKDERYSTSEAFKAAVSGVHIVYELAAPTSFTFTGANIPTLSGVNNVYANCGNVNLVYFTEQANPTADVVRLYQHKYSTEEHIVGTWIDGKPLYEKTVSCGAIPNAESTGGAFIIGISETAHNISNLDKIVYINGIGVGNGRYYPLPCNSYADKDVDVYVESGYILIVTNGMNWRGVTTESYVTLRYTKT